MNHTDDDTLTLMALGESPSVPDAAHVRGCARCTRELNALRQVVRAVASPAAGAPDLLEPPPEVWESIAGELGLAEPPAPADPAPPARSGPRRLGRFTVLLAACAALLGASAGSAVTWWATRDEPASTATEGRRIASLRAGSAGYARLDTGGAHRTLDITVEGLPRNAGYFEVWLMDSTHTKLVSVGVLGPDGRAALPVPDTLDLREYPVVDVSVQPYNGRPDHSGNSVVRGPYAG
ncbi:anti-sigma factor [Streptomyces sp. NPDC003717]|uniref:anti-sigma factor n=1 Tax=Streptomyces sp. NPDC003717 TaxID=3154276 RepID=UPI0033B08E48